MLHLDPSYIGRAWPAFMWTVAIVSALGCCMGFHEFVWFMSVGYGFSVMCIGMRQGSWQCSLPSTDTGWAAIS